MIQIRMPAMRPLRPHEKLLLVAALALTAGYFWLLAVLDRRAELYFESLRDSDPAAYLIQLRESRGFDDFLAEYTLMNDAARYRSSPPGFLIGRWTMREAPLRLTPDQAPERCSDPVIFENGLFVTVGENGLYKAAQYRITDGRVDMKTGDGAVIPLTLVSFGSELDHLEFTPPGAGAPVFAYLCGR